MDGPLRTRGVWGCIRGSQRRSARPEEETPGKLRRPSQGQASQAYPSEVFDLKPTSTLPSFVVKSGNGNHPGFYDKAGQCARGFEVEDLARIRLRSLALGWPA